MFSAAVPLHMETPLTIPDLKMKATWKQPRQHGVRLHVTEPLKLKARPGCQLSPFTKLRPADRFTLLHVGTRRSVMCMSPVRLEFMTAKAMQQLGVQ